MLNSPESGILIDLFFLFISNYFSLTNISNMRYYLTTLVIILIITLQSCDDSGIEPSKIPKGTITLRQKNFKHLEANVDGVYELWLRLDNGGILTNYSLGRFNINSNGEITDTSGGPVQLKYQGDTNKLYQSKLVFITVEPPGDYDPNPSTSVLLSGETSIVFDSIYANLTISGSEALGSVGQQLMTGVHTYYMLNTPTSTTGNCTRGVWFCDTLSNSYFPAGLQMFGTGWVYEGWVKDKSNPQIPIYYSTGRFTNPYDVDFDGAGICAGSLTPYSKPGQDWVLPNCPSDKPEITNLSSYNYEILITLEPSFEQASTTAYNTPFFVNLFKQPVIFPQSGCKRRDYVLNQNGSLPAASIKIQY